MAKVTGQTIPPQLAALYAALAGPGKVTQGPNGTLHLKPGNKRPKKKPRRNLDLLAIQRIAQIVDEELQRENGKPNPPNFVYNLTQDLILGIFNPDYFIKCKVKSAVTLSSAPTYIADPAPPPYSFRDPAFLPTKPTYPDGVLSSGNGAYVGRRELGLFADTNLKWRKIEFTAGAISQVKGEERVLIRWETRINIAATKRASRPMLSLLLQAHICTANAPQLLGTTPPIINRSSLYWRFKIPPSVAPFYNSYQIRKEVKPFGRIARKSGTGLITTYLINASNKPMMGRAFNNNDDVATSFTADPELWEIDPCLGGAGELMFRGSGNRICASALNGPSVAFDGGVCDDNTYSVEGDLLFKIAKPVNNGVISTDETTWLHIATGVQAEYFLEVIGATNPLTFYGNIGADKALFNLNPGELRTKEPLSRYTPTDSDLDSIYKTCVSAIDAEGKIAFQKITLEPMYFYRMTKTSGDRFFSPNNSEGIGYTTGNAFTTAAAAEAEVRAIMLGLHADNAAVNGIFGGGPGEMPGPPFDFTSWVSQWDFSILCDKINNVPVIGFSITPAIYDSVANVYRSNAKYVLSSNWGIPWSVTLQRLTDALDSPLFSETIANGIKTQISTLISPISYTAQ